MKYSLLLCVLLSSPCLGMYYNHQQQATNHWGAQETIVTNTLSQATTQRAKNMSTAPHSKPMAKTKSSLLVATGLAALITGGVLWSWLFKPAWYIDHARHKNQPNTMLSTQNN